MFLRSLFFVLFYFFCQEVVLAELDKNGKNVCQKTLEIRTNSSEYQEESIRCYGEESENLLSCLKNVHLGVVYQCCDGYVQEDNECKPVCSRCVHGECVGPNQCDCFPNFGGENCDEDEDCEFQKFGRHCEKHCGCVTDPYCSGNLVDHCSCIGEISSKCKDICKCKLRLCKPGLIGEKCQLSCPDYKYGRGCLQTCTCMRNNTLECDKESGECKCKGNFNGKRCENELF